MAFRVSTSRRLLSFGFIAAAELFSGCMPYGETAVYQIYKTNAERCSQNETDACVALLQTKCEAPVRVCTSYVPDFQAEASRQLTKDCQGKNEAACQALAAIRVRQRRFVGLPPAWHALRRTLLVMQSG